MADGLINLNATFAISTTIQDGADLTATQFAALTYENACCPPSIPDMSMESENLSTHCVSGRRLTSKGVADGSDFEIEVYPTDECLGEVELREAVTNGEVRAVRVTRANGTLTTTPTIIYARVRFTGVTYGGGEPNDFVTDTFSGVMEQDPVYVAPTTV